MSAVLRCLGDGAWHAEGSLEVPGGDLDTAGVLERLQALGVPLERDSARGCRLTEQIRPLDPFQIEEGLRRAGLLAADRLHVVEEIDSTNRFILDWPDPTNVRERVCLAECQLQGRGRRGRTWTDAAFRSIKMSVGWDLPAGQPAPPGLSLAAGIAVVEALEARGVQGVGLKWPNDVLHGGRKLAGLLVESVTGSGQPGRLVVGIGLNVAMPDPDREIDLPWTDLRAAGLRDVDRSALAVDLVEATVVALRQIERDGLEPFRPEFDRRHVYNGRQVRILGGGSALNGTVLGVDRQGALLLESADGATHVVLSGDVSLRHEAG